MFIFFGTEILLKGIYIREIIQEKGKVLCKKDNLCSTTYNCENIKTSQICCHNNKKASYRISSRLYCTRIKNYGFKD